MWLMEGINNLENIEYVQQEKIVRGNFNTTTRQKNSPQKERTILKREKI
jgi:hypothetical protein